MGFYIEELPTEFNGITLKEADYLADEFLKETPCNRMWDAVRALRDFYETVMSEAEQTEPSQTHDLRTETHGVRSKKELCAICEYHDWKIDEHIGYISVCKGIGKCPYNVVEIITSEPSTDYSWK